MRGRNRRRLLLTGGIVLVVALLSVILAQYVRFVTEARDQEVASQLSEVYGQINNQFTEMVNKNWNILQDGALAIELSQNEKRLDNYIKRLKNQWEFHQWMFIDDDGNYMDADGKTGHLDLGSDGDKLLNNGENIIIDGDLASNESLLIYAIPTQEDVYKGFRFKAIALAYNKEDMSDVLENTSFGGKGFCYLVYKDGLMLLALQHTEASRNNFFDAIQKAVFETSDYEQVHEEIQSGTAGTCRYHIEDRKYYLHYQPVGFQDWVMIGIIPQAEVGQHVNEIVERTTLLTFMCSALFLMVVIVFFYERNRVAITNKNNELSYRDQIFEILSGNTNNIFLVAHPGTFEVEYISSNVDRVLGLDRRRVKKDYKYMEQTMIWTDEESSKALLEKLPQGSMFSKEIVRRNMSTGEKLWFEDFIFHVKMEDIERYIVVMIDHTKEKKGREELQTALKIAEEANDAKSSFLSRMSHDIRTPINVIMGFMPLMKNDIKDSEKLLQYIDKIQMASQHLLGIINDILDMSKIESGEFSLNINEFKMTEELEKVTMLIRTQTKIKNQSFEVSVENIKNDDLDGDAAKIGQILMNILSNAVKYTPEGGKIIFIAQQLPKTAPNIAHFRFIIKDNGIGMSKEYQKIIYEPFTREDNNTGINEKGTGLGMAIVKNLLTLMGGIISIESQPGEGSTFTIEIGFRIHDAQSEISAGTGKNGRKKSKASGKKMNKKEEGVCLEGLHALIVEDYRLNAEILQGMLEMYGMTSDICENGLEAVQRMEQVEEGYYDLILMDILMPVMNGYEATRAIRKGTYPGAKTIPVIAMSANAFAEDVQRGMEAGMNDYLTKPLDMNVLKNTLNKILENPKKE